MFPFTPVGMKSDSYEFQSWFIRLKEWIKNRDGFVTVTAAYTVPAGVGLVRVDATSGGVTVTLPPAANWPGREIYIKKIDASGNAATLARAGSDTIDGSTSAATTTQYAVIGVKSVGTGWDKVEG